MNITEKTIIGDLVAEDYRTAAVFKKHKIDFCCNGIRSLTDACNDKNIETTTLIKELEESTLQNEKNTVNYASWPADLLADYIEKKHHRYVQAKILEITPYLEKIVLVHGERHPELAEVATLFHESAGELTAHMKKEELMLFPFIRKMVESNGKPVKASFGSVQQPIAMMFHEHDTEGERFRKIAALTNDYTPPADACNTYRVTFSLLKEFEEDLHLHIHLENNILFPKAIRMEETMTG